MKLRHWIRFALFHDTTWHGQFRSLAGLLLNKPDVTKLVVDVGANDGFYSSNSYPFIRRGWEAVLVEPQPDYFRKAAHLHRKRDRVRLLQIACSDREGEMQLSPTRGAYDPIWHLSASNEPSASASPMPSSDASIPVKVERLETILDRFGVASQFGLLSIDTEGHDLCVLKGLNMERFRPTAIITEKETSDTEKAAFLQAHDYRLHATLEYDTVWTC